MSSFILKLFTVTDNNLVEIGLVTEKFIPNCQSLFFKLIQLAFKQEEFRETSTVSTLLFLTN